jgi:UPF0176 protein
MSIVVAAFYKFVSISDTDALQARLATSMAARGMRGTILLAREGINGTISADAQHMFDFLAELRADARFCDLVTREARLDTHPFKRLKVKIKAEIVTFGHPGGDPTMRVGTYVAPQDWNGLISSPDVFVLDTRNVYEVAEGTFRGAADPGTRSFGELPTYVETMLDPARHTRVAMFCTGGIRCEKASAYLLSKGFSEVYHLQGGILNYLAKVAPAESLFEGRCFVFDERETVGAEADTLPSDGGDDLCLPTE